MRKIIGFCYTHQISFVDVAAIEVLSAAGRFCMNSLISECEGLLGKVFGLLDWQKLMDISLTHSMISLREKLVDLSTFQFNVIMQDSFLSEMKASHWEVLLSEIGGHGPSEEDLFLKFVEWTKKDLDNRFDTFETLVQQIRFPQMTPKELVKICFIDLVESSKCCRKLIDEAKDCHLLGDDSALLRKLYPQHIFWAPRTSPMRPSRHSE